MIGKKLHVLVAEADDTDADELVRALAETGDVEISLDRARRLDEALQHLGHRSYDAVLLNLVLPDSEGLATLARVDATGGDIPVIVLASVEDELLALKAVQAGAADYLLKNQVFGTVIRRAIRHAIQRKSDSRQLAASHAQRILETVTDGIAMIARDGRIIYANLAAEKILGLSRREIESRLFNDAAWAIQAMDGTAYTDLPITQVFATGQPVYGIEVSVERADGCRIYLSLNAAALLRHETPVEAVIISFRDISAQHFVDERLHFQSTLLEAVGQAVWATDADGRIIYWNHRAEELYGVRAHSVLGMPAAAFDFFGSPETLNQVITRSQQGADSLHEITLTRPDGSSHIIQLSAAPLRRTGVIGGMVVTATDLTQVRGLEQQLNQVQKMDAIGRLAGGIAHDFNNLLTAIKGYTDFLMGQVDDATLRADLEEVEKAADRAAELTRQLLMFSRKNVPRTTVVDLSATLQDMERMLQRLIGEHIEMRFHFKNGQPGYVLADHSQIQQVILNLVVNARDAMEGGGTLDIELDEADEGGTRYVVLRVSDTGHGIEANHIPLLFEPFFTTKGAARGVGLGLSTAYGIVAQAGGRIDVASTPGRGTSFTVFLPRTDEIPPGEEVSAEIDVRGRDEIILYVEDDEPVRSVGSRMLREFGYQVFETQTAREALLLAEQLDIHIDLLLTDIVMPKMNGRELAERVRSIRPGLPVVFVSGYTDDMTQTVLTAGDQEILEKPFTAKTLARRVRQALDSAAPTSCAE